MRNITNANLRFNMVAVGLQHFFCASHHPNSNLIKGANAIRSRIFQQVAKDSNSMYGPQIERLKRDSNELKHYMKRVEKEGNQSLVFKLQKKHDYLNSKIGDLEEALH